MHPFHNFIQQYERLYRESKRIQMGGFPGTARPQIPDNAPRVLIFSPHPDDECIIGALPLRLLRQSKMNVINVAVTQGSNKQRQSARLEELKGACNFVGFGLVTTASGGLERVNPKTRDQDPAHWNQSVQVIADILQKQAPKIIFFPHPHDWNSSHIGTHYLVTDALETLSGFSCHTVETEYWGQNNRPNLMVQSSAEDVADLVAGTSFHVGEVTRNPFHLFLPAWMQENVRRGSELVGGQGEAAPEWTFATLYRLRRWQNGAFHDSAPQLLPIDANPRALFPAL